MPYIVPNHRININEEIDKIITTILAEIPTEKRVGAANYTITRILLGILKPQNYSEMNATIGVLECAKLEMYRRLVGPYEDKAIEKNGDLEEYGL